MRGETSVREERLGETLVRSACSARDLERATEIVVRDGKRLGEALHELGLLDKQRIEVGLAQQVRDILAQSSPRARAPTASRSSPLDARPRS